MTYGRFKKLITGMLLGDTKLPGDNDITLALLENAFVLVADRADAMRLMTKSNSNNILRKGLGDFYVRMPKLPVLDEDELDIDHELCFPLARFVASIVTKDRQSLHISAAESMIRDYNAEVYNVVNSTKEEAEDA